MGSRSDVPSIPRESLRDLGPRWGEHYGEQSEQPRDDAAAPPERTSARHPLLARLLARPRKHP